MSTDTEAVLTGLKKYTNYTVQVLAFTNGGDGVKSTELSSTTEQDIPGPPSSVKPLAMSEDSILVSWKAPDEPNGIVVQYTVYIKVIFRIISLAVACGKFHIFLNISQELDRSRDTAPKSHKVNALQMSHQVDNLNRKSRYEFWVTASTVIGEGPASVKVGETFNSKSVAGGGGGGAVAAATTTTATTTTTTNQ